MAQSLYDTEQPSRPGDVQPGRGGFAPDAAPTSLDLKEPSPYSIGVGKLSDLGSGRETHGFARGCSSIRAAFQRTAGTTRVVESWRVRFSAFGF